MIPEVLMLKQAYYKIEILKLYAIAEIRFFFDCYA